MSDKQRRYHAYLLRLWTTRTDEATTWRSSLEEPRHGHKKTFANLSDLFAFLEEQTTDSDEQKSQARANSFQDQPDNSKGEPQH